MTAATDSCHRKMGQPPHITIWHATRHGHCNLRQSGRNETHIVLGPFCTSARDCARLTASACISCITAWRAPHISNNESNQLALLACGTVVAQFCVYPTADTCATPGHTSGGNRRLHPALLPAAACCGPLHKPTCRHRLLTSTPSHHDHSLRIAYRRSNTLRTMHHAFRLCGR
jgi:hypothetical protein